MIYVHCQKTYNLFVRALEIGRKAILWQAFLSFFQRVQMNFIFSNNVYILCLSCNVKKPKTTVKSSKKRINKHSNQVFIWYPL